MSKSVEMPAKIYSILAMDDNPADLFLIEEAFSESGFPCQLSMTSSADEARRLLSSKRFDFMISDFGSDAEEGKSFIESIRALNQAVPIVILSGHHISNPAYESGANAFVRKDTDLEKFFAKIQAVMQFWVSVAELPTPSQPVKSATNN